MSPITDSAQALAGLLRTAEDDGMPLPFDASVNEHNHIVMIVHTLDDLSDWSTWLDEPIDDTADPYRGKVHCHVRGMAGPIPVRVTALVAPELLVAS